LAPHIESEIQPVIFVESAARAAKQVNINVAAARERNRLIHTSGDLGKTSSFSIMHFASAFGKSGETGTPAPA
jgi:hypothetical protein